MLHDNPTQVTTFSYDLEEAIRATKAMIPHLERNVQSEPERLKNIYITEDGSQWLGTDRYSLAEYTFGEEDNKVSSVYGDNHGALWDRVLEGGEAIILPRAAIDFISKTNLKNLRKQGGVQRLTVTLDPVTKSVTVEVSSYDTNAKNRSPEFSQSFNKGEDANHYPPVAKLFEQKGNREKFGDAVTRTFAHERLEGWVKSAKALKSLMDITFAEDSKAALVELDRMRGIVMPVTRLE